MNTKLDFHLQGAPNFRVADLNVYGVAQPTVRHHQRLSDKSPVVLNVI